MTPIEASRANIIRPNATAFQSHYRVLVVHYSETFDIVAVTIENVNGGTDPFILTADRFHNWEVIS